MFHHHHHLHLNNIKHHHQTSSLFVFRSFPVSDRLGLQSTAGRPEWLFIAQSQPEMAHDSSSILVDTD
jgi:hypothetical protein